MKFIEKKLWCLTFFCLVHVTVLAQNYVQLNRFTTDNGLPSNHIYDIIEDSNGFLWIATDNGVSRFDGKYFQNFSIKNGLTSNDVLQIVKDGTGTIWANNFKQLPCYFDVTNNRFITLNNSILTEIAKSFINFRHQIDGSIKFFNERGYVVVKGKNLLVAKLVKTAREEMSIKKHIIWPTFLNQVNPKNLTIYINQRQKKADTIRIATSKKIDLWSSNEERMYVMCGNTLFKISINSFKPFKYEVDSLQMHNKIVWYKFVNQTLHLTNTKGEVFMFDKNTLRPIAQLLNKNPANCAYQDKAKNLWIGTLDNGLLYYSATGIKTIETPQNVKTNFLSITATPKQSFYAGNYYGEIFYSIKNKQSVYRENPNNWIRKAISLGNKTVIVRDLGYSINFGSINRISDHKNNQIGLKNAIVLNDSLLVMGSTSGLYKLNVQSNNLQQIPNIFGRIITLIKGNQNNFYYVSEKGLYCYNYNKNSNKFISLNQNDNNTKLLALAYAPNNMLWASTTQGDLIVLKNEKTFATLKSEVLPQNINTMVAINNKIWLGSKTGVAVLTYTFANGTIKYSIKNISKTDGLSSNSINDFAIGSDTIYVATENGISLIPVNYQAPKFKINPQLVAIKINQKDTTVLKKYHLKSYQNNIALQFAGVDLTGHFRNIQYTINKKDNWNNLAGNTLNIQLTNGDNTIYIRAIDVNNQVSERNFSINFNIDTPYFKTKWFWALIAFFISGIGFYLYNKRKLIAQKTKFDQQIALETQRKKITADLHDDIGATLSSLQLNSAIANELMLKDPEKTQKILAKIEDQSKNLADKIGDIIWSMKPGKDEFMTLGNRIKNFANDILGATNINYNIEISNEVNKALTNITARKNTVLIAKEAINNIAKYSQATQANIKLNIVNNTLLISIKDNGIGFAQPKETGNGLNNMKKRAEELQGTFKINTEQKKGTEIIVCIPLVP